MRVEDDEALFLTKVADEKIKSDMPRENAKFLFGSNQHSSSPTEFSQTETGEVLTHFGTT